MKLNKSKKIEQEDLSDKCFNIENIDDLPEQCRKDINKSKRGFSDKTRLIIKLFGIKPILTIPEVIAGMYRVHNVIVERNWVYSTLKSLSTKGILQCPKYGIYKNVLELPDKYKHLIDDCKGEKK